MLGFAACNMIRRIVGFAHVADFESIANPGARAACEAGALAMARLLVSPEDSRADEDVIDVVQSSTDFRGIPRG